MEEYYTIEELTEKFGVSRQTVSAWIKKGKIKVIKIDRKVFIPKDQFEN